MTDEKLQKAQELKQRIDKLEKAIREASTKNVFIAYLSDNGNWAHYGHGIKPDIYGAVRLMLLAYFQEELKKVMIEWEAL